MASTQHKQEICGLIQSATSTSDLDTIINSIPTDELQSLLQGYIQNQNSSDKLAKILYSSKPLPRIIGQDCMNHILGYLDWFDLSRTMRVSKVFKDESNTIKHAAASFDHLLLTNAAFKLYFDDDLEDDFSFGYFLQNKYDTKDLNSCTFEELGEAGILKGEDMIMYQICDHFEFEMDLVAWSKSQGDDYISDCDFRNIRVDPYWDCWFEIPWSGGSYGEGIRHARISAMDKFGEVDCHFDMCPVVHITCKDDEWRSEFLSRAKKQL